MIKPQETTTKMPCWTAKVAFITGKITEINVILSYLIATSIMIITSFLFLLKQSTLIISHYFSICRYYIILACCEKIMFCLVSNNVVSDECDVLMDKAALCIQGSKVRCIALCVQQNDVQKELKDAEEFRSCYAMFVRLFNNREYH